MLRDGFLTDPGEMTRKEKKHWRRLMCLWFGVYLFCAVLKQAKINYNMADDEEKRRTIFGRLDLIDLTKDDFKKKESFAQWPGDLTALLPDYDDGYNKWLHWLNALMREREVLSFMAKLSLHEDVSWKGIRRLFFDVDIPKEVKDARGYIPPSKEQLIAWGKILRTRFKSVIFNNVTVLYRGSSGGFHVVFRNLDVDWRNAEDRKAVTAFTEKMKFDLMSVMGDLFNKTYKYKLDTLPMGRGDLSMCGFYGANSACLHLREHDPNRVYTKIFKGLLNDLFPAEFHPYPYLDTSIFISDLFETTSNICELDSRPAVQTFTLPFRDADFQSQPAPPPALVAAPDVARVTIGSPQRSITVALDGVTDDNLFDPRPYEKAAEKWYEPHDFAFGTEGPSPVDALTLMSQIHYAMKGGKNVHVAVMYVFNMHFAWITSIGEVYMRRWDHQMSTVVIGAKPLLWKGMFNTCKYPYNVQVKDKDNPGQTVVERKEVDCCKYWLANLGKRTYESAVFAPFPVGHKLYPRPELRRFNTFNGWRWTVEEMRRAERVPKFMELRKLVNQHIFRIICACDWQKYQFFMCLLAAKFRNPSFKPNCAIIITGKEGAGKSWIFEDLILILAGAYGILCSDIGRATGDFNSLFDEKLFMIFDEASWAGNMKGNTQLKNMVTAQTKIVNTKHKDMKQVGTYELIMLISNNTVVVPQGESARRWVYYPCAPNSARGQKKQHSEKFDKLSQVKDDDFGGVKAWAAQLFDETLFPQPLLDSYGLFSTHHFPQKCVEEGHRQKSFSLKPVEKFWQNVLTVGSVYPPHEDYHMNSYVAEKHVQKWDKQQVVGKQKPIFKPDQIWLWNFPIVVEKELSYREGIRNTYQGYPEAWGVFSGRTLKSSFDLTAYDAWAKKRNKDMSAVEQVPRSPNLADVLHRFRHPEYLPDKAWLGTINLALAYEKFQKSKTGLNSSLTKYSGVDANMDYPGFCYQSARLFGDIGEDNAHCFKSFVEPSWIRLSRLRMNPEIKDWAGLRSDPPASGVEALGAFEQVFMVVGDLAESRKKFYYQIGVDTTPGQKLKSEEDKQNVSFVNADWKKKQIQELGLTEKQLGFPFDRSEGKKMFETMSLESALELTAVAAPPRIPEVGPPPVHQVSPPSTPKNRSQRMLNEAITQHKKRKERNEKEDRENPIDPTPSKKARLQSKTPFPLLQMGKRLLQ